MRRAASLMLIAVSLALGGCLERRIFITSDPPGALVRLNDVEVGRTPVEVDFLYYGKYDVRLEKDGFEPLWVSAHAAAPIHEQPGFDLLAEMWPGKVRTEIRWHYNLERTDARADDVLARARDMRESVGGVPPGPDTAPVGVPIIIDDPIEGAEQPLPRPVRERLIPPPSGPPSDPNTPPPPPLTR